MKVYTKKGDLGQTSLVSSESVSKSHPRLEAYGTVDELNALLGVLSCELLEQSELANSNLVQEIESIQNQLFNLGSQLACADNELAKKLPTILEDEILFLEQAIDTMSSNHPELKNFLIPGTPKSASLFHLARCITRRAERAVVILTESESNINPIWIKYLNRLSDYFFIGSRHCNYLLKVPEKLWKS